jgi:hypothetical protein
MSVLEKLPQASKKTNKTNKMRLREFQSSCKARAGWPDHKTGGGLLRRPLRLFLAAQQGRQPRIR